MDIDKQARPPTVSLNPMDMAHSFSGLGFKKRRRWSGRVYSFVFQQPAGLRTGRPIRGERTPSSVRRLAASAPSSIETFYV